MGDSDRKRGSVDIEPLIAPSPWDIPRKIPFFDPKRCPACILRRSCSIPWQNPELLLMTPPIQCPISHYTAFMCDIHARDSSQRTPLDISIDCGFGADIKKMLVDRCSEHVQGSADQMKMGDPAAKVVEMDDASCNNETPGRYPEKQPARKRRYSTVFPSESN
ncbi:hypothetical protein DFP73DRAFT_538432 [Morchella snyderi]|nr:hypothetical protein DFP73DRAFT_538432 [Morchella snyderi]